MTSRFDSLLTHEDAHHERVLAGTRVFFSTVSLVAIYVDATEPSHYTALAYAMLVAYVAYSAVVLLLLRTRRAGIRGCIVMHVVDVCAAAALTLFTEGPNSPFFVLFGFALLAAAFRWGLWPTVWTGIACALLYALQGLLVAQSGLPLIEGVFELNRFIIRLAYLLLFAAMIGYLGEQQRRSRSQLAGVASATERARLARELHDGIVQSLLGIRMGFEALRQQIGHERVAADLERSEAILTTEITNLRTLMFELSPVDSPDRDLGQVLPELVERFQHASGIVARFISDGDLPRTSPRVAHEVIRIVQEALVNVYKHSGAQRVLVTVFGRDRHCCIMVDDDGRGFDFDGHLNDDDLERLRKGPRVIKERVRLLGGTVTIRSTPGSGSQLEIVLPRRM